MKRIAIVENSPMVGRYFRPPIEAEGAGYEAFPVWRGAPFPRGAFDAYIMTGDLHNITDGLKRYHTRELEFLEGLGEARVFASCFSHQLVALARGGTVSRRGSRLLGWELVRVTGEHPALEGISSFPALCLNTDEVTAPPAEARVMGESDNCRFQVLAYGEDVLTCQAHPEVGRVAALGALAFLLSGGPTERYGRFRASRSIADDEAGRLFVRSVVRWLLEQ